MARASNPENHPSPKTPPGPAPTKMSINDVPAMSTHGGKPNFPGVPNVSTDKTTIPGYSKGADHGWFNQ